MTDETDECPECSELPEGRTCIPCLVDKEMRQHADIYDALADE